jgi:hypothetical protein
MKAEEIPNLRKRILEAGLIPLLCTLGQEGVIRTYHVIQPDEITMESQIAKGRIFIYHPFLDR